MKRWVHEPKEMDLSNLKIVSIAVADDSRTADPRNYTAMGIDANINSVWFVTADDESENCCINVEGYEKPMRGRSAMICLKEEDSRIYVMCKPNEDDYGVPGGGWNLGESLKDAALRELHEETFTDAENIVRIGTLIEYHEEVKDWVKEHVSDPDDWWYGYYSAIFVGTYAGEFYGQVAEEDRESGYRWELLDNVEDQFPVEYRNAIHDYLERSYT